MTLIVPTSATPQARSSRLGSLAASGALLVLPTSAAIALATSDDAIVRAAHLLVALH